MNANLKTLFLALATIIYIVIVLRPPFSFTGFWTDIIVTYVLTFTLLYRLNTLALEKDLYHKFSKFLIIIISIFVFGLTIFTALYPMSWNRLETTIVNTSTSSVFLELEYFHRVGAWGCGFGSYWKTKTLLFFPVIEYQTYMESCSHEQWDKKYDNGISD